MNFAHRNLRPAAFPTLNPPVQRSPGSVVPSNMAQYGGSVKRVTTNRVTNGFNNYPARPPDAKSTIPKLLRGIHESGDYSDLQINCGDRSFQVHRNIVCPQSEYFKRVCEGLFKEAKESTIILREDEPEHVKKMIDYFYTHDYKDNDTFSSADGYAHYVGTRSPSLDFMDDGSSYQESTSSISSFCERALCAQLVNVGMYALGEKYMIPKLKELAKYKFHYHDHSDWLHGASELLRQIWGTTPESDRGLRNTIIHVCINHVVETAQNIDEYEEYQQVLKEFPEAHVEILSGKLSRLEIDNVGYRRELRDACDTLSRRKTDLAEKDKTLAARNKTIDKLNDKVSALDWQVDKLQHELSESEMERKKTKEAFGQFKDTILKWRVPHRRWNPPQPQRSVPETKKERQMITMMPLSPIRPHQPRPQRVGRLMQNGYFRNLPGAPSPPSHRGSKIKEEPTD